MKNTLKFVMVLLVVGINAESPVSFQNYQVFRVEVLNQNQLEALRQLEYSSVDGINFWKSPSFVGQRSDVMVAPHQIAMFAGLMERFRFERSVMIENVQRLIDDQKPTTRATGYDFKNYHSLETMNNWLDGMLLEYSTILTELEVGKTYQNRTIRAVRLSHKEGNPIVFIEATIHPQEWMTSATANYLLNELLTSTDPELQEMARNIDWVFVPVLNVDGLVYTQTTNRHWRKTLQPHGQICYGANLNRNFDAEWMSTGASDNICSQLFAGPHAFSEVESRAFADFVASFSGQIKVFLAFHQYGQLFMHPWGHTADPPADVVVLNAVAEKAQEAFARRYGTIYNIGASSTTIYETSGSSVDWVYATQNVTLAYTVEFRDTGHYGVLLPADQIIPNSEEMLDALVAIVREARVQNIL